MDSMPLVVGGIETHKDLHTAAVVDESGEVLATRSFATTRQGYRQLVRWMRERGTVDRVGVEQTGSYGAGVTRQLGLAGITVLEVTGPDISVRRGRGKDDTLDAIAAAVLPWTGSESASPRAAMAASKPYACSAPARQTAVKARRAALQQLNNTIIAAPDEVREQTRSMTRMQLVRTLGAWRPDRDQANDPTVATKIALRSLARRIIDLGDEIAALDELIKPLVTELNPRLVEALGIGIQVAGQLLVTAGDNPDRLASESGFAMLCGVAPLPASSGMTRHRLNRGGDRAGNSALDMAAICRLRLCPKTRAYAARRKTEGLSKREIISCLKRYIARETYQLLTAEATP